MSKILGKDVAVYIYDGGVWKLYACGTNCTLTTTTDFIETSAPGDGKYRTFVPTVNSFTGSIEGLTNLQLANTLSLPDLRQKQLAHVLLLMQFERTDIGAVNTYVDQVYFYISEVSDSGPNDGMNSFSISLRGTGSITQLFVPTPQLTGEVKNLYINGTGTETGLTTFTPAAGILINKTIVGIWRGTDFYPIYTGTPTATQVKYTIATGQFDWLIPLEPDEIIHVQYQDI